jgi:hypothetical protein
MALNLLPDADGDGTVNCGPGWLAGAYYPDDAEGSTPISVSDKTRVLIDGDANPTYFDFGDLKATVGGPLTVDPPGVTLLIDFSA